MNGRNEYSTDTMKQAVITASNEEKVRKAVALQYEQGDTAPKIIATGKGVLAEKIIEGAIEAEVPVHRDDKLAETLSKLSFGDYIPPELYEVVVEVLMFVDKVDTIRSKMTDTGK